MQQTDVHFSRQRGRIKLLDHFHRCACIACQREQIDVAAKYQAKRDGGVSQAVKTAVSTVRARFEPQRIQNPIEQPADGVEATQPVVFFREKHIVIRFAKPFGGLVCQQRFVHTHCLRQADRGCFVTLDFGRCQTQVSTLAGVYGERAVLRLLDKSDSRLSLQAVGMPEHTLQRFEQLVQQPHGMVLVTGPTGSGKTTTLYAALQLLDTKQTNIMTVEDPIEYELSGIGQTQVNAKIGLDFAKALRAILRQDPDVIMVGEIRDRESAQIAVQASLTGHLVLATLHTNDAVSAVTRLTDMGIEPFLLSSSLLGVLAQRLVRKRCISCHGTGCKPCGQTGYQGRTGIFELLVTDTRLCELIHRQAGESELRDAATQSGMRSLRDDGQRWVAQGVTSAQELLRVTRD